MLGNAEEEEVVYQSNAKTDQSFKAILYTFILS